MNQTAILWPMVAHALLVYIVYVLLGLRRVGSVKAGQAKAAQFRNRGDEPSLSTTAANNLINQFELPVLFHMVCLALFVTNGVSDVPVLLAWLFIVSRYLHSFVHMTVNRLRHRNLLFRAGLIAVGILWIWFALHLAGLV